MSAPIDPKDQRQRALQRYWRSNIKIMSALLAVWAVVGLGCGVLFADALNSFKLGGVPLGFWFAQQGSIATFVVLILIYAILMNRLDAKYLKVIQDIEAQAQTQAQADKQGGDA